MNLSSSITGGVTSTIAPPQALHSSYAPDPGLEDSTPAASGSNQPDQATLSSASSFISQAVGSSSPDSDVRTEKIAALQQAIADGTYNVSASDVADKIIGSLLR
ncbi:flagellar biosynthesis anti-sigma factor FlgM [Granulicella sp. WH15]|uniref:flagellar biosynthesis anti-sigma factor FlgM n=1 Tax=Granulicella sp. WH15 TaxID=2602070 RepID=UPI0013A5704E|nr:flagellar biosynthesis anti-sigma factor FlgM [Granulicella sp. WH15]